MALRTAAIHGDKRYMKILVFCIWMVSIANGLNFDDFYLHKRGTPSSYELLLCYTQRFQRQLKQEVQVTSRLF